MNALRTFWLRPGVRRRFVEKLGIPLDLTLLRILRAVESLARSQPGVSEIAAALSVESSTASRLIARAVEADLVVRSSSRIDQRRAVIELAPLGLAAVTEANRLRESLLAEAVRDWSNDEIATLSRLLGKLRAGLERWDPAYGSDDA